MADDPLFQRFGKEFPAGAVLFRDGEAGKEMFVIQQGRVSISKRVGEVEKILSSLGPGEFLGEMAILNNKPRSATATCAEPCKLLVIDAKTFEAMIRGNGEIAIRMIKKLADRLQEANEQIENLLVAGACARVAHLLASAAEKVARGPGGHRVGIAPRELAGRVGVTPEQAEEALATRVRARLVSAPPDGLVVPDVAALRRFLERLQSRSRPGEAA